MQAPDLLTALGYRDSLSFLAADAPPDWSASGAAGFAHHFRRIGQQHALRGIYCLGANEGGRSLLPLVCVVKVDSDDCADALHRQVWNQDFVPFLLVETPQHFRLYSGFEYASADSSNEHTERGLLVPIIHFNEIQRKLKGLHARAIEDGEIWREHGAKLHPERRLDWHLLRNLEKLGQRLKRDGLTHVPTAHSLIGKYIYFNYLRARGILSRHRLKAWGLTESQVFGRQATLDGLARLCEHLADWPNGGIFPLRLDGKDAPRKEHLAQVAGTFAGDDPESGQLHLDFRAYDFAHIPIETLSVVYEQFMHAEGTAKQKGAFYTPVPLIDFMVAELQATRPLRDGMRVLDPACGSGAFLVQCYRLLVEAKRHELGKMPSPVELRRLLVDHIFGVDSDGEACRVAALSLSLALLDYIEDIQGEADRRRFKLPDLHNQNIFEADFFAPGSSTFSARMQDVRFDWIVGNPPWKELPVGNARKVKPEDRIVFEWMREHAVSYPTGGGKLAEAFAWYAAEHLTESGAIGLLLHAGSLFNLESNTFRERFFSAMTVFCLVNFANLRRRLFAGRMEEPAMAVFYAPRSRASTLNEQPRDPDILCYAPLVANQEVTLPRGKAKRQDPFCLVVNASEIRRVSIVEAQRGDFLPWKLALWGSHRDQRLLDKLARRFPTFDNFAREHRWVRSQGPELRHADSPEALAGKTEYVDELRGKLRLDVKQLKNTERIFSFPASSLRSLSREECYVRERGGVKNPLAVCRPPHVLVSEARTFAVFSDQFIAIPPRQIAIAGSDNQAPLLKALALFLNADFCQYHPFWLSPAWGIRTAVATLAALKMLPIPLDQLDAAGLRRWEQLHDALAGGMDREEGLQALNREVNDLLGLSLVERYLVHDLVHVRMELIESKLGQPAVRAPKMQELVQYGEVLRDELDGFFGPPGRGRHQVTVLAAEHAGLVEVRFREPSGKLPSVQVLKGSADAAMRLNELRDHLRQRHSQWLYFDRDLRVYEGTGPNRRVILAKPLQRFHFTSSQALLDADEIIADLVGGGDRGGPS